MDTLRLKNMRFYAYHGCKAAETEMGQRFEVDVELKGSMKLAGLTDDLTNAIDYDRIYQIVSETVTGSRYKLVEALTEEICRNLLKAFPDVQVRTVVRKPQVPVAGILDYAEIEMVRGPVQDQGKRR